MVSARDVELSMRSSHLPTIVEVSPRDGLQSERVHLATTTKVSLIQRAVDAGLRRIETVGFAHPDQVPQLRDAEAVMASLSRIDGVRWSGLALNTRSVQRAATAGVHEVNFVIPVTNSFALRNQGRTTAELVREWGDCVAIARGEGISTTLTLAVAFGCPFDGEVPAARVLAIAEEVLAEDPDELSLADTIGVGVPGLVVELFESLGPLVAGVTLRGHFHNTRNTGYANAWAALQAGATVLDASIGGFGGCPFAPGATGNIATEDLAYLLKRSGIDAGVSHHRLARAARWLGEQLDQPPSGQLSRVSDFPSGPRPPG